MNSASIRILELLEQGIIDVDDTIRMLKTAATVPNFKLRKINRSTAKMINRPSIFSDLPTYFSPMNSANNI